MTREYNHDDVCRGSVDGCDHEDGWCGGCERNVPAIELEGDPPRCEECNEEINELMALADEAERLGSVDAAINSYIALASHELGQ